MTIQPLKTEFKIDEEKGFVPDQIKSRVNSEDWYTNCKRYPLTETEDKIDPFFPRMKRID